MGEHNHSSIVQEHPNSVIESSVFRGFFAGSSGKLWNPQNDTIASAGIEQYALEFPQYNCGTIRIIGVMQPQSSGNIVIRLGFSPIATFPNDFVSTSDNFVHFIAEIFWDNGLDAKASIVTFQTPSTINGVRTYYDGGSGLSGSTSIKIESDYGIVNYNNKGIFIMQGGGA